MNEQELANCHCIISHPTKPKFLVIKHTNRWSPPILKFPLEGSIVSKARMINDGMMNKYGLRTVVLRQVAAARNYHCIELEMQSEIGSRNLNAVWVGSKEYKQFRSSKPGEFDPFELWLKQRESGKIPVRRPAWEQAAWFKKADHWIHQQLDRLNIQVTGSVQQLRAFKKSSCILYVPTSQGKIFLKASSAMPPLEATLTQALARNWPELIPEPIALDAKSNWMLMRDYYGPTSRQVKFEDYPVIARMLANIQMESLESRDTWEKLGCPVHGLDHLSDFLQQLDKLAPILTGGRGIALNEEEFERVKNSAEELQLVCRELARYSIPHTLVHPDFWYSNISVKNGKFQLNDWMGTVISHPFFSLLKFLRFRELWGSNQPELPAKRAYDRKLKQNIVDAYLEPFARFEKQDRLQTVMALVSMLQPAWRLCKWSREIGYQEPESLSYHEIAHGLQEIARQMISPEAG